MFEILDQLFKLVLVQDAFHWITILYINRYVCVYISHISGQGKCNRRYWYNVNWEYEGNI